MIVYTPLTVMELTKLITSSESAAAASLSHRAKKNTSVSHHAPVTCTIDLTSGNDVRCDQLILT